MARTSLKPVIHIIAALVAGRGLERKRRSGVGLADFITRRLRDGIDEQKTFLNSFTTGHMERVKIPATFSDDLGSYSVVRIAGRYGEKGWIAIPNTLHLETLYASEDLRDELAANPICRDRSPEPVELLFQDGRHQLVF